MTLQLSSQAPVPASAPRAHRWPVIESLPHAASASAFRRARGGHVAGTCAPAGTEIIAESYDSAIIFSSPHAGQRAAHTPVARRRKPASGAAAVPTCKAHLSAVGASTLARNACVPFAADEAVRLARCVRPSGCSGWPTGLRAVRSCRRAGARTTPCAWAAGRGRSRAGAASRGACPVLPETS